MKPERELAVRHNYADLGEVRLHYAECGSGDRLVILLHGFPEFWYSWRHQLPVLGKHYRVVAPDMRGFNLSDKPPRKSDYQIEKLVDDVLGLIKHFGQTRAAIVAHDWGAGVAWALAQRHPEAVSKLAALQVPLAAAWRDNMSFAQLRRSWYMFFFQLPGLPERWASAKDFARLDEMFRKTSFRPGAFSDEDIEAYKNALRQPGALTSSLNYYRANVLRGLLRKGVETPSEGDGRIRVPTLFIYGELDTAVIPSTVRNLSRYFDAPYRELRIPDSGHWVQNEAVKEVNGALLDFLGDKSLAAN
jgi:pimeloyl-ACP methyl ester carboxylesterase